MPQSSSWSELSVALTSDGSVWFRFGNFIPVHSLVTEGGRRNANMTAVVANIPNKKVRTVTDKYEATFRIVIIFASRSDQSTSGTFFIKPVNCVRGNVEVHSLLVSNLTCRVLQGDRDQT